jgi:hypothetical protein
VRRPRLLSQRRETRRSERRIIPGAACGLPIDRRIATRILIQATLAHDGVAEVLPSMVKIERANSCAAAADIVTAAR